MKRLLACILVLVLLLSMAACEINIPKQTDPTEPAATKPTETKPVETQPIENEDPGVTPIEVLIAGEYVSEYTDDYIMLAYVTWDSVILSEASAEAYPKLAAALETYSREDAAFADEQLQEMIPEAERMADWMGSDFYGFSYETSCSIQRADSSIFSARFDYYAYTGGARPYYGTTAWNLDPASGSRISLSQVITDMDQLPTVLAQAMREKYDYLDQATFDDIGSILSRYAEESYVWTLGYQGVTFYFAPSEIAPSAAGSLEATLWFNEHPELFEEAYTQLPEGGYVIPVPESTQVDVDLDPEKDGYDQLYVFLDGYGTLSVGKNGNAVRDDNYFAYYADTYLVTPDNERFYLYIDCTAENDYSTFHVYDVNGTTPELLTVIEGEGFSGMWVEDYFLGGNWFNEVFNNPAHFLMAGRLDLLGTMSGTRPFHVDPFTGLPVAEVDYYTLPAERDPLVTKISLTVKLLPGLVDYEIPAGTRLWFMRSNGTSYVDMRMADGKQCRIYLEYRNWQAYINGIPEEDCFEGIYYAG